MGFNGFTHYGAMIGAASAIISYWSYVISRSYPFTHTRSLVIAETQLSVSSSSSAVDAEAVPPARLIRNDR